MAAFCSRTIRSSSSSALRWTLWPTIAVHEGRRAMCVHHCRQRRRYRMKSRLFLNRYLLEARLQLRPSKSRAMLPGRLSAPYTAASEYPTELANSKVPYRHSGAACTWAPAEIRLRKLFRTVKIPFLLLSTSYTKLLLHSEVNAKVRRADKLATANSVLQQAYGVFTLASSERNLAAGHISHHRVSI